MITKPFFSNKVFDQDSWIAVQNFTNNNFSSDKKACSHKLASAFIKDVGGFRGIMTATAKLGLL